jgi:hypothetical protein
MKEKDIIKGNELERLTDELFGLFDPEDESSIGGGPYTNTAVATYTPNGFDAMVDLDFRDFEAQ